MSKIKKDNKKQKNNKTKIIIGVSIIIIIGIIIVISAICLSNKKGKYTKLEEIALNYFSEDIDLSFFLDEMKSKEEAKIDCAIKKYINTNPITINEKKIIEIYNNMFEDQITSEKLQVELMRNNLFIDNYRVPEIAQEEQYLEEQQRQNNYMYNMQGEKFKKINSIKTINKKEFEMNYDVVNDVDINKIINYYSNPEQMDYTGISDLYSYRDGRSYNINWSTYINNNNYQEIATEIKSVTVIIKVEDENIRILDIICN